MSRARNIKPSFFLNPELGELTAATRLLFIGLWCLSDREGRLLNRPARIRAELFPYEPQLDVAPLLTSLEQAGFIVQYVADDKTCIQVVNFVKHQNPHHKEVESGLPAPSGGSNSVCEGYRPVTDALRASIKQRDPHHCNYCGSSEDLHVDHIIPITRGGNSNPENLQILCRTCNCSKGNRLVDHGQCLAQGRVVLASSMNQEHANQNAPCPTDTGYLNPESGTLNPDVLNADVATVVAPAPKNTTKVRKDANPRTSLVQFLENTGGLPPAEWASYPRTEHGWNAEQLNAVWRAFHRYWSSPDCPKPLKRDWKGTWENWCDRDAKNGGGGRNTGGGAGGNLAAAVNGFVARRGGIQGSNGTGAVPEDGKAREDAGHGGMYLPDGQIAF